MSKPLWWHLVEEDIDNQLEGFTEKLRKKLQVGPLKILQRRNPFLLRVRCGDNAADLVRVAIDAYLSSSEETMFGYILEETAISVCSHAKQGQKSAAEGIDLEFEDDRIRNLVQIKSGPNWGNASQKAKLKDNFLSAGKRLRALGASGMEVRYIEGCCYGKSTIQDKGSHLKLVGSTFWTAISGFDGTTELVMDALSKHSENGLNEPKESACGEMLSMLEDKGVISNSAIDWQLLCKLMMDD